MVAFSTLSPEDQATALHVRKVYAHLEQVGVPGDGFADGIERTREHRRLSTNPHTQQSIDLTEPELAVLRCADRYGFFKNPGSERLIPLNPRTFFPSTISKPNPEVNSITHQSSKEHEIEANRISKWTEMLEGDKRDEGSNIISYKLSDEWESQRERFSKRCYKGIPDRWRRAAWDLLIKDYGIRNQVGKWESVEALFEKFEEDAMLPSDQDVQIDLDVPRTINGHVFFHTRYGRGQRALFQVLHAFGMYCETCGYCQGMGPIAATLLNYFDAQMAYVCMVRLHDWYNLHTIFAPGFPGMVECFYVQERVIEYLLPDVHNTFTAQMISTSSYATKWYITLFANTVPFEAQLRLWDVLFLDGIDVLILASVAIVYALRGQLGPGNDFEMILSKLGGRFELGEGGAIGWIRSIRKLGRRKDLRSIMSSARVKWKGFVKDGSASKMVT
ncbi:hypothetical protein CROQUDRAFT_45957 [Cronartium quercuum f. sp. fusiforme G11]|uniref:Rab-GAP TBC domain-containing protein n=1 Tax=Cronartium quercuum f. sp. fusiforme G11 TaxID=708437 RepID=A0A9P6NGS8_9BASI|nr:hypothetical protein CROQUDRAFT_45957 [Cronartium quercuum f. sp. fusiforme G11]